METIRSEQLLRWVPGKVLLSSEHSEWTGVSMRSFRYTGLDVDVPPVDDYLIVAYCRGSTPMARRVNGPWQNEQCGPGDVSVLTRAEPSHWRWTRGIDVVHLYLDPRTLARVSAEALDRDIADVSLRDVLKASDPIIAGAAHAIAEEARQPGVGGRLYVEALATQMSVHLLRHYASVTQRRPSRTAALSASQARRVADYVETHLDSSLQLQELAAFAGLSAWHFLRQFRGHFGVPPHAYVMQRRIERARELVVRGVLPLKEIAVVCGFSDQAHMTRLFRRQFGMTPGAVRTSST